MGTFFQELFHAGLYKRTQGRITRQVTFASVAVVRGLGLLAAERDADRRRQGGQLRGAGRGCSWSGLWMSYRLVNVPAFADFLIAVEAEMNKVSWPTRGELIRSSIVVLVTIFVLAAILFVLRLCVELDFRAGGRHSQAQLGLGQAEVQVDGRRRLACREGLIEGDLPGE